MSIFILSQTFAPTSPYNVCCHLFKVLVWLQCWHTLSFILQAPVFCLQRLLLLFPRLLLTAELTWQSGYSLKNGWQVFAQLEKLHLSELDHCCLEWSIIKKIFFFNNCIVDDSLVHSDSLLQPHLGIQTFGETTWFVKGDAICSLSNACPVLWGSRARMILIITGT